MRRAIHRRSGFATFAAACVVAASVACTGDPGTTAATAKPSQADVKSMMGALANAGAFKYNFSKFTAIASGQVGAQSSGLTASTVAIDDQIACPDGGSVRVLGTASGTNSASGAPTVYSLAVGATFTACKATSPSDNTHFEFDTDSAYAMTLNATFTPAGSYTASGRAAGDLKWSSAGRTGTCDLDVVITPVTTPRATRVTGSVCGLSVDYTY